MKKFKFIFQVVLLCSPLVLCSHNQNTTSEKTKIQTAVFSKLVSKINIEHKNASMALILVQDCNTIPEINN
ncbi:hypothetical protein LG651_14355 [Tamlana sp. 62-3]|uniref:Uncharacterized protein n=1 Tax=Neotamlana sargassicola TaxID=2883125 RepID=A0A9X1L8E2_9FLAO|nr:hypothetical protein [Tamlana sargassicola]MCB4809434.1 hypothetical protein [Tamlana sargassicola]